MKKVITFIMVLAMVLSVSSVAFAAGVSCSDSCTDSTHVAAVGTTHYTDIQEAIEAAANGGTVELLRDVTVAEWKMFSQTLNHADIIKVNPINVTIDGNGNTLEISSIKSGVNGGYLFKDVTKLNIKDLIITYATGVSGGICVASGTIENVTINGGNVGILPGTGGVTISGCTFKTNNDAIYYENDGENLIITGNTFETNVAADSYAIILRGKTTFTGNTFTKGGGVNVTGTASGEISGNNFGDQLFRVYSASTATISNNTINNLVFRDNTVPQATFTDNTLSDAANNAITDAGTTNTVTTPAPAPAPQQPSAIDKFEKKVDNQTEQYINSISISGGRVKFTLSGNGATVLADGVVVYPDANGVYTVANNAKVTITYGNYGVEIPKTGDMPLWAAVLALFGF